MNVENLSFGNAAGTIKTLEDVKKACKTAMTDITVGSITYKKREGNIPDKGHGRVYYYHPTEQWSVNALGMPNMGMTEFLRVLPDMVKLAHRAEKNLRVSVAGFTPDEYAAMTAECYDTGADEVELNLGCPNVWGPDGEKKPIPSFDSTLTRTILLKTRSVLSAKKKVAVKVSPVMNDRWTVRELMQMFGDLGCVSSVVGVNTIPNQEREAHDNYPGLSFEDGKHQGGGAGSMIRQSSLEFHELARTHLQSKVGYIAVGGIATGKDVFNHLRLGATGFQCGTEYLEQGGKIFSDLIEQTLTEIEQAA